MSSYRFKTCFIGYNVFSWISANQKKSHTAFYICCIALIKILIFLFLSFSLNHSPMSLHCSLPCCPVSRNAKRTQSFSKESPLSSQSRSRHIVALSCLQTKASQPAISSHAASAVNHKHCSGGILPDFWFCGAIVVPIPGANQVRRGMPTD